MVKTILVVFLMILAITSGNSAEAQVSRAVNQNIGTWHAPQEAQERGLPARIVINRFSGAAVGNRNCKWKSESRSINYWGMMTRTALAAVIECANMEEIVVMPTSDDFTQDKLWVTFGDGPGYLYSSAKFLEQQRRARESPPQRWGQ